MVRSPVIILANLFLAKFCFALHDGREVAQDFSNEWVVHLDNTNASFDPDFLAEELGYQNMGEVGLVHTT